MARRFGYTIRDNPRKILTVISSSTGQFLASATTVCRRLEPTGDEVADALAKALTEAGRTPVHLSCDSALAVSRLRRLVHPTGVLIGFYAPPSPEETHLINSVLPHLLPNYYLPGGRSLAVKPPWQTTAEVRNPVVGHEKPG